MGEITLLIRAGRRLRLTMRARVCLEGIPRRAYHIEHPAGAAAKMPRPVGVVK